MKLLVAPSESSALPPLYAGWMVSFLGGDIPAESNATCDDCAMCDSTAAPRGHATYYNPATKCCTYLPALPNFLVGRMLFESGSTANFDRRPLDLRLAGPNVSPLGVSVPSGYDTLYKSFANRFGRSLEMRCPHYIEATGQCGIWRHRSAVCATWFCKYVRAKTGEKFWNALHRLLLAVETDLAAWCVDELFTDARALLELLASTRNGKPVSLATEDGPTEIPHDSPRYRSIWGEWFGREQQFFQKCAALVNALNWSNVLEIAGPSTRMLARAVSAAYQGLFDTRIPAAVRMSKIQIAELGAQTVQVTAYSPLDPITIPRELFDALSEFDGRPTDEAVALISDKHNLEFTADVLRELVDFGILGPVDDPAPS